MNWKQYKYELILALLFVFAASSLVYKNVRHSAATAQKRQTTKEAAALEEIVDLKKLWGDTRILRKLESVHTTVAPSKLQWNVKGRKLTAIFSNLQAGELNRIVSKMLNIPVQIVSLKIAKSQGFYKMEIRCKW